MIGAFLAILVAQASPIPSPAASPVPVPTLSPSWVKAPFDNKEEYAHFVRREQDGTDSVLYASRRVCDCQAADMLTMFTGVVSQIPNASIRSDQIAICGGTAERAIVTGLASANNSHRNFVMVVFRHEPALYTFMYTFRYAAPMPDAESALAALCP